MNFLLLANMIFFFNTFQNFLIWPRSEAAYNSMTRRIKWFALFRQTQFQFSHTEKKRLI